MNLQLSLRHFSDIFKQTPQGFSVDGLLNEVIYDTRNLNDGRDKVFFALQGKFRSGFDFIEPAYDQGVRVFVVDKEVPNKKTDACYFVVEDTLEALIKLAAWHRMRFDIPIVAIVGTHGKTTVKEWLGQFIKAKYQLVKSPKSYNSKQGIALSILELHSKATFSIFEVSITHPKEGALIKSMLQPTHGAICHVGDKYNENFGSPSGKFEEYSQLFSECVFVFYLEESNVKNRLGSSLKMKSISPKEFTAELDSLNFNEDLKIKNASLALGIANYFGASISKENIEVRDVAMRLETFDGIQNSLIINDTYSLDLESLEAALQYQMAIAKGKKRLVLLPQEHNLQKSELLLLLNRYVPDAFYFISETYALEASIADSVILVKGNKQSWMSKMANQLKVKHHRTKINVNLSALRNNIHHLKDLLPKKTKALVMVKANAYGTGLSKTGPYIDQLGIDYLGVAYTDEGVQLREQGVKCPILVMSPGIDDFHDCIEYMLEPAIFSLSLLDDFIKELISRKMKGFPVHLKIDTGMNRLGISPKEVPDFIDTLRSQPEIHLKGVYSHFAESDHKDMSFTQQQFDTFKECCARIQEQVSQPFLRHIANSSAILNHPETSLDMVRMGVVAYGVSEHPAIVNKLIPVIEWSSQVVQLRNLKNGDAVGYNREFIATRSMTIGIIPVGYADGFGRSLSHGVGAVYIKGMKCVTVGNVCMDMIMVDVTGLEIQENEPVEIIGSQQSLMDLARQLNTIPYEVLTSLSLRVHRNYVVN